MPNTRSRVEVEAVIKKMAGIVGFVTGPLTFGANLAPPGAPGIIYFDGTHYWGWTGSAYSQLDWEKSGA